MGSVEMFQMRRHGDVMIMTQKGFKIPKGVKLKAGKLIHKGANNSHVIGKGAARIAEANGHLDPKGNKIEKFLRVTELSTVAHVGGSATHDTKPLPEGDYWVLIQRFYDHVAEESKQVVD